ncbi:hypothetical protein O181_026157 [Austropuccinia psidii MF-1]|uniref:Uncharacterized protein n=1 Tax=Austropuccinia psidii MF-1 TaxID=1389203 RepID=A0A9Q3CMJ7_9BASI|nr:hypothetical protein [Austropuccinia psidii MF-1]
MSLKEKTHINTIFNIWVITPHGASQKFGILMLIHEMTSAPLADCLPLYHAYSNAGTGLRTTALVSLLSPILTSPHPCLIISATYHAYAPPLPSHALNLPYLHS